MVSKRKFLTLADRVKVSKMADADRTSRWIAKDVGVGKSQIIKWLVRKLFEEKQYHFQEDVR